MEDYSSTKLKVKYSKYYSGVATLDLAGEGLSRVPDAAIERSEVQVLSLEKNKLTKLPTSINKLNRLIWLHLDGNNLTELPAEIGDLKELLQLSVSGNPLTVDAIKFALKLEKRGLYTDIAGEDK